MEGRLRDLVLYIARCSESDPHFGATKLHKILFYVDFMAYGMWGKSITGARYVHQTHGPIADKLGAVIEELVDEGAARIEERDWFEYKQRRLIAVRDPDISQLNEQELALVDEAIERLRPLNARELSEWTHSLLPWLLTVKGEEIPLYTVYVWKVLPPSADTIRWARALVEDLGG